MKKLIKYLLFIFVLVCIYTTNTNAKVKFIEGDYADKIYINKVKNGITYYMRSQFLTKSDDHTYAYCLDPFELFNSNDSYTANNTYSKISSTNLDKIKLAAYYGYGYTGHTAQKWYAITQLIIWKYADSKGNYYFTDTLNGNKITKYDADINNLQNLINNHYKSPSFANNNYEITLGQKLTLTDSNNVIANYSNSTTDGINIEKNENKYIISSNKIGNYSINLTKKNSRIGSNPIFYLTDGAQNLMTTGNLSDVNAKLSIKVIGGTLNINKFDADTKACKASGEGTLTGSTYSLYKDNSYIKDLVIDDNCTASINNLELGNYVLKETIPGNGYTLDKKEYQFTISEDNLNINLNLTNKIIKRKINITKLYGDKELKNYKVEANVKFAIYDKDNILVSELTTDKGGDTSIILPYGTYTLKQLTSTKNYKKIEDRIIKIKDDKEDINLILKDDLITKRIKVPDTISNIDNYFFTRVLLNSFIYEKKKYI